MNPNIRWGILRLRGHFSFVIAGLSYLLNTQVSLSIWFFHVLYAFQTGLFKHLGYTLGAHEPFCHLEPAVGHQATGATMVFVLASLWMARRHLLRVLHCAWRPDPRVEDPGGLLTYRWAVLMFFVGLGVMYGWLVLCGMKWWTAALYLIAALGIIYFLARVVAQTGIAAARPVFIPQTVVTHAAGMASFRPAGLVVLAYGFAWSADVRSCVMASMANGLRVAASSAPSGDQVSSWRRRLQVAVLLAVLVSLLVSYVSVIGLSYRYGAVNSGQWFLRGLPIYTHKYATQLLEGSITASGRRWAFTALGAAVMTLLTLAQKLFVWWPIHPVGFVLGATAPVQWSWTGIFVAWLLKSLVLKYGGPRLYTRTRDMAIGLVLGQVLCAGLWLLIASVFGIHNLRVPIL
jgi:hypothetical protein